MIVLGLNVFHGDSSACIIKDGVLISAIEEERFTRVKHTAGFPIQAIKSCLSESKIKIDEIDYITLNRNPNLRIIKKIIYAITRGLFVKKINDRYKNFKLIKNIEKEFNKHFDNESSLASKIIHIDHHLYNFVLNRMYILTNLDHHLKLL